MRLQVDQSTGARNRGVIGRVLIQCNAHKVPQAKSIHQSPRDTAFRFDALEIPDHQRPEIDPGRQSRTPQLLGVKPCTQLLNEPVESLAVEDLVQTNIERVTRAHGHIRIRHPQILLPLPILARSHRHDPILRMTPVDAAQFLCEGIRTCTTGCYGTSINQAGVVSGSYPDANGTYHGFMRTKDGDLIVFNASDAGPDFGQGTYSQSNNASNAIPGF